MKFILPIFVTILSSSIANTAYAQSAVLVMLKAEKNRITALEKRNLKKDADIVRQEASIIMEKTISDFTDHFKYCAVYYFVDTNADLIREKKFENVLFDKNFKPYSTSPLKKNDSSFVISYYGIPPVNVQEKGRGGVPDNTYREERHLNKGLVVLGHDFKRIRNQDFFYRYESWWPKDKITDYDFISVNFDMAYIHSAGKLQTVLRDIYASHFRKR